MIYYVLVYVDRDNLLEKKKAFKNFGFDPECVYGCLNGKYGQHKGHTFHRRELSCDESFSRRGMDRSEIP